MRTLLLFLLLLSTTINAQQAEVTSFVQADARTAFRQRLLDTIITGNFSLPLNAQNGDRWREAFWGAQLLYDTRPTTLEKINEALQKAPGIGIGFTRAALEAAYTLNVHRYSPEISAIFDTVTNPKLFAMCAVYLLRSYELNPAALLMKAAEVFPDTGTNPILTCLIEETAALMDKNPNGRPDVTELLAYNGYKGATIYSLQRKNRDFPGVCVVKGADGRFLRDSAGKLICIPQLARSLSNLPGYITDGSTPEGVFAFTGFDNSSNIFIGPTDNLQMVMPFESSAAVYLHKPDYSGEMTKQAYEDLLPVGWRGYHPIYTAFYAGMAGRTEIIAHGTTVDPDYYKGMSFAPFTPTMGCLCTFEAYDASTGKLLESGQQRLADAVKSTGFTFGYVVVVNVNDERSAVTAAEAEALILKAER